MKIIHISDIHLGQIIYRHYDREDEHDFFFGQLTSLCEEETPDALLVTGDIFDIQQPSASTWRHFTEYFVGLHRRFPNLPVILIAGNHDSPSRLHSHKSVWKEIGTTIVALPPTGDIIRPGWEDDFIIELPSGFIIALPFMPVRKQESINHLLEYVKKRNRDGIPVVMTGHLAVNGSDLAGHDMEIGRIKTVELDELGKGYDYLALGHIHRAQTLGHPVKLQENEDDRGDTKILYSSPVARYAGSALHVSCDECYPHTISVITIDRHGGNVEVKTRKIQQLRHFHVLSEIDGAPFDTADDAIEMLKSFVKEGGDGYFRFRMNRILSLPSDFNQQVYELIDPLDGALRYNPKIEWRGGDNVVPGEENIPTFEVAELQQMMDPLKFIEKTIDRYPAIDLIKIREAFLEIEEEIRRMDEEK